MRAAESIMDLNDRRVFAFIAIGILVLGMILRVGLLTSPSPLFEPDGFFDYAVLQQAVQNHFVVGSTLLLSGFPWHNPIGEPKGEYYILLIPYYLLQHFNISILSLMRIIAPVFGLLYILLAYPLTKMLTKSRSAALLSMFFVAISNGSIARSAATVYRGDVFAPLFLILALLLLYRSVVEKRTTRKILYAIAAPLALSLMVALWNGAAFGYAAYVLALVLLTAASFIKRDCTIARSTLIAALPFILAYFMAHAMLYYGLSTNVGMQLIGVDFLAIYFGIIALSLLSMFLSRRKYGLRFMHSEKGRSVIVVSLFALSLAAVYIIFPGCARG